jgi:Domain of unknown function (DUF4424)
MTSAFTPRRAARRFALGAVLAAPFAAPLAMPPAAMANDTTAEIGAGGLVFARSDAISMDSEDLYLSRGEVRVAYRFTNTTDADIDTVVAFPMPDLRFGPDANLSIPDAEVDNFLGFTVTVDGAEVTPQLQQRAFANGVDVTETLLAAGLPLQPWSAAGREALDALSPEAAVELKALGAVTSLTYYEGETETTVNEAFWTLKTAYWWRASFPAGRQVTVEHAYRPAIGSTAGVSFSGPYVDAPWRDGYVRRYCMDEAFLAAVDKRVADGGDAPPFEERLQYVLSTGANWGGPIKDFTLTVDKGSADTMVSFCGEGVTKTGPTTFVMKKTDYWPEGDLDIVFVSKPAQ